MNITSQTAWRLTLLCCAILLLGVIGYSTYSIVRALRGTDQPETAISVPAPKEQATVPAAPSSREAIPAEAAPPTVKTAPSAFGGTSGISKEFELMRQREEGQKETIRIIRKEARENPDANNPSEEQLKEMEKSGVTVM